MNTSNNKISTRQLITLLVLDTFGTGVIILPRIAAGWAGPDAWIVIIGAALISIFYATIISSLAGMFPDDSFVEFSYKILSKWFGFPLCFIFAAKLILTAGIELRIFGEIVGQSMLHFTPIEVVMGLMLLTACYLVLKGYENRARMGEALFFVVFIPLFIVFFIAAFDADFTNLQPMFKTMPENIVKGSFMLSFSFRGSELVLLVYPFLRKPKRAFKGHIIAILFTAVVMIAVTIITIAKFGVSDTRVQIWPVLQMMDSIDIPGSLLERQDALILSFWIISVFISISAGVFFTSLILSKIFNRPTFHQNKGIPYQNRYILPSAAFIFAVAMLPQNVMQAYAWLNISDYTLGIFFLFIVPFVLLFIAKLRRMDRGVFK